MAKLPRHRIRTLRVTPNRFEDNPCAPRNPVPNAWDEEDEECEYEETEYEWVEEDEDEE